jgi:hypothetical protein
MPNYALLPTPGDPAVITFWKLFYDRIWGNLLDGLFVYHNPPAELMPHSDYIASLFDGPNITLIQAGGPTGHGPALATLVQHEHISDGDTVAFFEDDSIIFKRDQLASCLEIIKNVDIVASPRGSATPGIVGAATRRFGHCQAGEDTGPNFWPNLLFARKSLLQKTDLDFGSHGWEVGQRIDELNWTPGEQQAGDTMVWMSIQLRALTDRIHLVPQWHSSPYDLKYAEVGKGIWSEACQWFHIGSLSSIPFGRDLSGVRSCINSEMERLEWERRLMYVWLASEEAGRDSSFGLARDYEEWIMESARQLSLNLERMRLWIYAYRQRLGL